MNYYHIIIRSRKLLLFSTIKPLIQKLYNNYCYWREGVRLRPSQRGQSKIELQLKEVYILLYMMRIEKSLREIERRKEVHPSFLKNIRRMLTSILRAVVKHPK